MQHGRECPNCNSAHVVPDGRTINGCAVLYCTNCYSWFDAVYYEPVLFESDGGDDVPDAQPSPADDFTEMSE